MRFLKNILKSELFLITLLYSLSYGIILFNDGVFLDDWCCYNVARPAIMEMFRESGRPWFGYYIVFALSFKGMIAPRLVVFFSFLLSVLFLNGILKGIKEIEKPSRLFIVLLFALFPVNFARVALATSQYSFCFFVLFLGLWLFANYLKSNKTVLRFLSLFAFFISFFTNSILVFYSVLIALLIFYKERKNIYSLTGLMVQSIRYADFLALPVVFWFIMAVFFKPWGVYAGYNHVAFRSVVTAPVRSIMAFNESFIVVMNSAFSIFLSNICLAIIFGFLVFVLLSKTIKTEAGNGKYDVKFFFLGLILFFAAVFPYLAAGYMPKLRDWDSRHQLLVPLGASFILYYGVRLFLTRLGWRAQARVFVYALVIALFISVNFLSYVDYQKDWFKQLSLMQHFNSSRIIKDNTTFIFDDQTTDMNARGRVYRFYEYAGLMKSAFKDETRFGTNSDSYNTMEWNQFFVDYPHFINRREYNSSGYRPKDPDFRVVIRPGSCDLSRVYKVVNVLYYKIFAPDKFKEAIADIVKLEYVKL